MSSKNWADEASDDGSDAGDAGGLTNDHHYDNGGEGELLDNRRSTQAHRQGGHPPRENMPSRPPRQPTAEKDVPTKGPFIAYVGNLPFSADENMVGNFFEGGGCGVKDVIIKMGDDGRPRGFMNVEFFDRDSLCKALTANGEVLGGRSIRVDVDMKRSARNDIASGNRRDGDRDHRDGGGGRRGYREGGDVGGGRDRDDRPVRDEAPEPMWNRAAPRREQPPLPPRGNKRAGRDDRDRVADETPSAASDSGAAMTAPPPTPPASRPIIKIQPRTLPVETVGVHDAVPNQSIFGGGKAHDEKKYEEERKKKAEAERIAADAAVSRDLSPVVADAALDDKVPEAVEPVTANLAAISLAENGGQVTTASIVPPALVAPAPKERGGPLHVSKDRVGGRGPNFSAGGGRGRGGSGRGLEHRVHPSSRDGPPAIAGGGPPAHVISGPAGGGALGGGGGRGGGRKYGGDREGGTSSRGGGRGVTISDTGRGRGGSYARGGDGRGARGPGRSPYKEQHDSAISTTAVEAVKGSGDKKEKPKGGLPSGDAAVPPVKPITKPVSATVEHRSQLRNAFASLGDDSD